MAEPSMWWLRPRVVFSTLALVVVVAVLLAPTEQLGTAEPYLTSYSYAPNGARGFHDIAHRLGWPVERRLEPFRGAADSAATYAVLGPPIDLTSGEVGVLLAAVRAGAGLIAIPADDSPIADSLGLRQSERAAVPVATTARDEEGAEDGDSVVPDLQREPVAGAADALANAERYDGQLHRVLEMTRPLASGTVVFLSGRRFSDSSMRPIVIGQPLGRGRVIVVADPRILLNDTVRDSGFAMLPIRMLEWVSPAPGARVTFSEYHQGFGRHASVTKALARGLVGTPVGRAIGVVCVAALLLLLSHGKRPMPPRPRARIERRSPLEHVNALARAYEQIGATRTAVRHLVRGLRRRRIVGRRTIADTDLLRALADRHPAIAPDVERVIAGSELPVSPSELLSIGRAIATIERTLYQ